jgi:hypothetical protein
MVLGPLLEGVSGVEYKPGAVKPTGRGAKGRKGKAATEIDYDDPAAVARAKARDANLIMALTRGGIPIRDG